MGKVTRKRYGAEFKSRVALEAIRGELTLAELASKRARLPIIRQCTLLHLNRSGVYYRPVPQSEANLALMRLIDAQFLDTPYYGSRQMTWYLHRLGHEVGRKQVRRLVAIMDGSRVRFCPGVCRTRWTRSSVSRRYRMPSRAMAGAPEIFNTGQGSQFTTPRFIGIMEERQIRISMDGRGRWPYHVFIDRLWRSLKCECIRLHVFETGSELRAGLGRWIAHYNERRPHTALAGPTPDEAYHDVPTPSGSRLTPA